MSANMKSMIRMVLPLGLVAATGCSKSSGDAKPGAGSGAQAPAVQEAQPKATTAKSFVSSDGSSTVFPITEAAAEEFIKAGKGQVTVGASGTGGGFKKLCAGEIDLSGASRPIKTSEVELCKAKGIETIELPVAFDGIAVVVHPSNTWVDHLSLEELKTVWAPEAQGKITKWSQVRAGWPDEELHLFGPGADSGTYDYFTEVVVGVQHSSRGDFTSSEDDNVLVQGVSGDRLALGYFGFAYFKENKDKLRVVPIGEKKTTPSEDTIRTGSYAPLSRPIFIYVAKQASHRPEVQAFVEFYLAQAETLVPDVGYVPLTREAYELARKRFTARKAGSMYEGGHKSDTSLEALLSKEGT